MTKQESQAYQEIENFKANVEHKKNRLNVLMGRAQYNAIRSLEIVQNKFRDDGKMDLYWFWEVYNSVFPQKIA